MLRPCNAFAFLSNLIANTSITIHSSSTSLFLDSALTLPLPAGWYYLYPPNAYSESDRPILSYIDPSYLHFTGYTSQPPSTCTGVTNYPTGSCSILCLNVQPDTRPKAYLSQKDQPTANSNQFTHYTRLLATNSNLPLNRLTRQINTLSQIPLLYTPTPNCAPCNQQCRRPELTATEAESYLYGHLTLATPYTTEHALSLFGLHLSGTAYLYGPYSDYLVQAPLVPPIAINNKTRWTGTSPSIATNIRP